MSGRSVMSGGYGFGWCSRGVVGLLLVLVGCLVVPGVAFGAGAAWLVKGEADPTIARPGHEALIVVHVGNIGGVSDGSSVTVTDVLPADMRSVAAGEVVGSNGEIGDSAWQCSGSVVVSCTNNPGVLQKLLPSEGYQLGSTRKSEPAPHQNVGEAPEIGILTTVAGGASGSEVNEVRVAGGGAPFPAVSRVPVTFAETEAPFGFSTFVASAYNEDGSADTQAGSHPSQLTVSLGFNSFESPNGNLFPAGGDAKNIRVITPTGVVGDPQVAEACSREEFDGDSNGGVAPTCPTGSQVGVAVVSLGDFGSLVPSTIELPVYNLVPSPGVPAEFGFSYLGIYGLLEAEVRTGDSYDIAVNVDNTAQRALIGSVVTLWGVPGSPVHDRERYSDGETCLHTSSSGCAAGIAARPFLTTPASCGAPGVWEASSNTWLDPAGTVSDRIETTSNLDEPVTPSGCGLVPFTATVTAKPTSTQAESPTGLQVDVHIPQNDSDPNAIAEGNLKNITVKLPQGLSVSPSSANGLAACSESQIALGSDSAPGCPEASKIGSVEVDTPLLAEPLHGSVYLAEQDNNPFRSLLAIYFTAEGDGVVIKLAGHVEAGPEGQLTTTVENAPELPFEDFKLEFYSGERAPLITPAGCGTYTSQATLTPWSSTPSSPVTVQDSDQFQITSGCSNAFTPAVKAGATGSGAGSATGFTTTFSRADGEQRFGGISVQLPPGLLASVNGVPRCTNSQAETGSCPPGSEIGKTTVAAGPGSDPYWINGKAYLTESYEGAPFGLAIVTQAIAGPFNLGQVIVRAKIEINPRTAQVSVISNPLPTILQGIPLDLRTINVAVERPGFMRNPTSCAAFAVNSTITSTTGTASTASTPFAVAGCSALPFKPAFSAQVSPHASKLDGAALSIKLASSETQANIAKVKVALPKQLPSRLETLQKACLAAVFAANPAACPPESLVGAATAHTPLLASPLHGPAYLVSYGGAKFPDIVIVLQGEGITLELDGTTNIKNGITTSTFNTIPDAPVNTFELTLPQGRYSLLTAYLPKAKYNLCGQTLNMPTTLTAQNNNTTTQTTKITTPDCPKPHKTNNKHKTSTKHSTKHSNNNKK
jgi:hypothetical protein